MLDLVDTSPFPKPMGAILSPYRAFRYALWRTWAACNSCSGHLIWNVYGYRPTDLKAVLTAVVVSA